MTGKIILCRCEDVTLADVHHAVATGFDSLEEIKRYTGFGTGPCQGKECLVAVTRAWLQATANADATPPGVAPFTSRPPLAPTPLAAFADRAPAGGPGSDQE